MTKIEILNKYKKQKHNTYRECDVINAMEKYLEYYKQYQALQLQQTDVMPCFSVEQIERINKYARNQYNRGQLDLPLVSFEEWVNKA